MRQHLKSVLVAFAVAMPLTAWPAEQEPHSQCAGGSAADALPRELAGWSSRTPVTAAKDANGLAKAAIPIGKSAEAALASTREMHYLVRPEKPGGTVSYGGMFSVAIAQAGTYRVALGSGAWVDVLRGKSAAMSVGHGRGPACSGIVKMVDFALVPGKYTLQIAANGDSSVPVLIAKLP